MVNPWDQIISPSKDVSALRADGKHPLDLFWAKDHLGRYLFIYEYSLAIDKEIKDPPNLVGIETLTMRASKDVTRLVLVLRDKTNWELFYALCNDLIAATALLKENAGAPSIILHRLQRWQDFLKRMRTGILPEEIIKGLIGELLFLKNHLAPKYGFTDSVSFWVGPEGAPQDYNINDTAVEVKCQLGSTSPNIKISSADQLYSQLAKLYLFVVTLGKSTSTTINAVSLPSIIESITHELEKESSTALQKFQDLLIEIGYYYSEKYLEYNYLLLEEHVYLVVDGFPRINPEDLHTGIVRLTYNISIAECRPFEQEFQNWELLV